MQLKGSQRGVGFVELILAFTILCGALVYFVRGQHSIQYKLAEVDESFLAETFASELLEFFRALKPAEQRTYLQTNPYQATSCPACAPYFFCSHINLLDRAANKIMNGDPIADLPPTVLDGDSPGKRANRFYQIRIINVKTLAERGGSKAYCSTTPLTAPALAADERFFVTVGVSWFSQNSPDNLKRVVLSSLIP